MNFQTLKQNYIKGLLATKAILVKPISEDTFTLRSGKRSPVYFDHSRLALDPKAYKAFIDAIQYLLKKVYQEKDFVLCNVDSKISPQMAGSIAYNLNKPQIIYKTKELTEVEKGQKWQITGESSWDLPVAIVDDVATSIDGTAKRVGDLVKTTFSNLTDIQIFVGVSRNTQEGTYKKYYLTTEDELIAIIWKDLNEEQQQAIEKDRSLRNGF